MNIRVPSTLKYSFAALLCTALLLLAGAFAPALAADADFEETVAELSNKLELDAEQSKQLGTSIQSYAKQPDTLFAEQEAENADPAKLIDGVKQAQAGFESSLNSFMSSDPFNQYLELKAQALKTMLSDLATIQLLDAQPKTT